MGFFISRVINMSYEEIEVGKRYWYKPYYPLTDTEIGVCMAKSKHEAVMSRRSKYLEPKAVSYVHILAPENYSSKQSGYTPKWWNPFSWFPRYSWFEDQQKGREADETPN